MSERSAAPAPLETELKLDAPQGVSESDLADLVRELGLEAAPLIKRTHVDRYLDTEALDLARRGVGLRLRQEDGNARLGVKLRGRGPGAGGVWRRVERESELAHGARLPRSAAELPAELRHYTQPFALERPLREVARITTERRARLLAAPASDAHAELCLDRVRVGRDAAGPRFTEIEIEDVSLGDATLQALSIALQERLGLVPSRVDKLGRALALLGALPPTAPSVPFAPDTPLRRAACIIFERHLEALRLAEPEAREGIDPEGVHRMRVATRRLRAAFRLFAEAFPPGRLDGLAGFMQRAGGALGPVRDLDVMLIELPELAREVPAALAAELEPLAAMLEGFHGRARERLLRFLESPARLRALGRFEAFAQRGIASRPRGAGAGPLREVAPALLEAAVARVWKRGDKIDKRSAPEALHRLRISIKRLRYTAEALAPLYGDELDGWLRRATELQDVLGTFNDTGVAAAHLSGWIDTREGRRLPRRTLVAAGALLAIYEQRGEAARKRFRQAWRQFARPKARRAWSEIVRGIGDGGQLVKLLPKATT